MRETTSIGSFQVGVCCIVDANGQRLSGGCGIIQ